MDAVFLCVYVLEALLKLIALDLDYFRDPWNDIGGSPREGTQGILAGRWGREIPWGWGPQGDETSHLGVAWGSGQWGKRGASA